MNDLKPFEHGEEGTHSCCQEISEKMGGKAVCCECSGHKCKPTTSPCKLACSKCGICPEHDCQPTEKLSHYPDCDINIGKKCDCWGNYKATEKKANKQLFDEITRLTQPTEKPMAWEEELNGLIPNAVFKVENENRKDRGIVTVDRSSVKQFIKDLLKEERADERNKTFDFVNAVNGAAKESNKAQRKMVDDYKVAEYKQKLKKLFNKQIKKNVDVRINKGLGQALKILDEVEAVIKGN